MHAIVIFVIIMLMLFCRLRNDSIEPLTTLTTPVKPAATPPVKPATPVATLTTPVKPATPVATPPVKPATPVATPPVKRVKPKHVKPVQSSNEARNYAGVSYL